MRYLIGNDAGISSAAVALLDINDQKIHSDLRIFRTGDAATRRSYRSQRRNTVRSADRKRMIRRLNQHYLSTPTILGRINDPLGYRLKGLSDKISKAELASCMLHMSKHRGQRPEIGLDADHSSEVSEVLWIKRCHEAHVKSGEPYFNRDGKKKKNIDHNRTDLQAEFDQLWLTQMNHHSDLTEEIKEQYREVLFHQLSWWWPHSTTNKCPYFPSDEVVQKCDMYAQQYRLFEALANIRVDGKRLSAKDRDAALDLLKEKNLTPIRLTELVGSANHNLVAPIAKDWFEVRVASAIPLGRDNRELREKLNRLIVSISSYGSCSLDRLNRILQKQGCSGEQCARMVQAIKKALKDMPRGRLAYSRNLLTKGGLLKRMRTGENSVEAIPKLGIKEKPPKVIQLPNLPNAVANSSLREQDRLMRKCLSLVDVDDVCIGVELSRDVRQPKKVREMREARQRANERENNKIKEMVAESGLQPTGKWLERSKLWIEQGGKDLISGVDIPLPDVVSPGVTEIDHIIAQAKGGHDRNDNRMLLTSTTHHDKGDRLLRDYVGETKCKEMAEWYASPHTFVLNGCEFRVKPNKDKGKSILATKDDVEAQVWKKGDLPTTSYIESEFVSYVEAKYLPTHPKRVIRISPLMVATLRRYWGLQELLDASKDKREDHRHHVIDAIVVACLTLPQIRNRIEKALWSHKTDDMKIDPPWGTVESFREDIADCLAGLIVPHRINRKLKGPLHADTQLSCYDKSRNLFRKRQKLDKALTIRYSTARSKLDIPDVSEQEEGGHGIGGKIEGYHVRKYILQTLTDHNCIGEFYSRKKVTDLIDQGLLPRYVNIVARMNNVEEVSLRDSAGKIVGVRYYAKSDNYHAIVRDCGGKWKIEVVSRLEAAQKKRKGAIPPIKEDGVIMVLYKNSMLQIQQDVWRVAKMQNNRVSLVKHYDTTTDSTKYRNMSAKQLQESGAVLYAIEG